MIKLALYYPQMTFFLFPGEHLTAVQLAIAGGFSGILTTSVMAPGERIKCILQV